MRRSHLAPPSIGLLAILAMLAGSAFAQAQQLGATVNAASGGGLVVLFVTPGSPANRAGLQVQNILQTAEVNTGNYRQLSAPSNLIAARNAALAGQGRMTLYVRRGTQQLTVPVALRSGGPVVTAAPVPSNSGGPRLYSPRRAPATNGGRR